MSAQQANLNLQYQQQLQQQHQQHLQQQQQQQLNAQQTPRRRRRTPVKKTFPTTVSSTMRDRQSRGKDTYDKDDDAPDEEEEEEEGDEEDQILAGYDDDDKTNSSGFSCASEAFETRERRAFALAVLDRPEQLMMYANTTNDSVASQRLRFTAMMCGFDDEADWRNNTHYKATLALARDRQLKMRRGISIDPREG